MRSSYIGQAHSNVLRLSSQGFTLGSAGPTKLVRVVSEGFGLRETLLLPILGDALLLAPVDIQEVARAMRSFLPESRIFAFTDVSITYHRIRLHTDRMKQALATMAEMESSVLIGALIQDILAQCLYPAVSSANALNQADDHLTLALGFARFDNYPLAAIAVAKAKSALRAFECQSNGSMNSERMDIIWATLANLEQTLSAMAS
jgi:hypothetical protein